MKKNKGFTLIELLAVIVILAIIALIAIPMVLNTIEKAKIGAAEQSATEYVTSIENTVVKDLINQVNHADKEGYQYDEIDVDIKGTIPTSGTYTLKNGRVEKANFCISGYYIEYKNGYSKYKKDKNCRDISDSNEPIISTGPTKVDATITDTHKGIVYLDPTDLTKVCNEENSTSETEKKEGCMKWYIYSEDDSDYKMILDHNTTALVAWNSSEKSADGMGEVKTALANDTIKWNEEIRKTARLITADEVAVMTGAKDALEWISDKTYANPPVKGTSISYFYLDGLYGTDTIWHTQVAKAQGTSKYSWLYDNTYGCTSYGCNISDDKVYVYSGTNENNIYGYWTSTSVVGTDNGAWSVGRLGRVSNVGVGYGDNSGVRPVITISKSKIS